MSAAPHCSKQKCGRSEILDYYWRSYVDIHIINKFLNKLLYAVFLPDSSKNTACNNLFKQLLFHGITFDDIFVDVTLNNNRNKECRIKIADTLVKGS